jgi:hypothetical protein
MTTKTFLIGVLIFVLFIAIPLVVSYVWLINWGSEATLYMTNQEKSKLYNMPDYEITDIRTEKTDSIDVVKVNVKYKLKKDGEYFSNLGLQLKEANVNIIYGYE